MKPKGITIGINIDMQEFYDDLVLYRKSIDAQINVLEDSPSICTHKKVEDIANGVKICANKFCNKIIDKGIHDWVK